MVTDGEPVPPATVRFRSDTMEWVELEAEVAPDGTFAFADLPESARAGFLGRNVLEAYGISQ